MTRSPTSDRPRLDLLREAVLRVRLLAGDRPSITLPGVFARLCGGDIASFDGLRVHQRAAWHTFLVQVAALAIGEGPEEPFPTDERWWLDALMALADGAESAWSLVVPDLARPAFFQPPVPEGNLDSFDVSETPDGLDVLATSKNHEGKVDRMRSPSPDHWVYALTTLQTVEGFSGRMNYGVARMNSGFGSRAFVGVTPGVGWGPRFRRDVRVALASRPDLCRTHGFAARDGVRLLWLAPWDGAPASALGLSRCDPLCVEVCRRVRLVDDDGIVRARTRSTVAARIRCVKGTPFPSDPWIPVRRSDGAPLALASDGFTYAKTQELLFGEDYKAAAAQAIRPDDGPRPRWTATALVRGQGVTGGWHSREIPIPAAVRRRLAAAGGVERIGRVSKAQVERAALVRKSVLWPALLVLLQGAPLKLSFKDRRADRWVDRFESIVDTQFFPSLWERSAADADGDDAAWDRRLYEAARAVFVEAIEDCPLPSIARFRAVATAENYFYGQARKHLGEAAMSPAADGGHHVV